MKKKKTLIVIIKSILTIVHNKIAIFWIHGLE